MDTHKTISVSEQSKDDTKGKIYDGDGFGLSDGIFLNDVEVEEPIEVSSDTIASFGSLSPPRNENITNKLEQQVHSVNKDNCDLQDTSGIRAKILRETPLKEVHKQRHVLGCDICIFEATKGKELEEHFDKVHSELDKFKCFFCPYQAVNIHCVSKHYRKNHAINGTPYKCCFCKHVSSGFSDLYRHLLHVHERYDRFYCDQCDYKTVHPQHLKKHWNLNHGPKHLKCEYCDFRGHSKNYIKGHTLAVHIQKDRVLCTKCVPEKTISVHNIKAHIRRVHIRNEKLKCNECNFETRYKFALKTHINGKHLKLENFSCDECDYKACEKYRIRDHISRVHLQIKKFCCTLCEYRSNGRPGLSSHMKSKHGK